MDIQIIASGSRGNCFLYDKNILLDAGVGLGLLWRKVNIKSLSCVLLTHRHSDHFNKQTIRRLYIKNRKIKFVCGEFLLEELLKIGIPRESIKVLKAGKIYKIGELKIAPIKLYHNVPNFGYRIVKGEYKHIHITDTAHLDCIYAGRYNSATLECNHHIDRAKQIIRKAKENGEFTHLIGALNSHLAVQQSVKWLRENQIKRVYPVHIGGSTYKEVMEYLQNFKTEIKIER
jgi:phosphoribosyl 1,2-cyclic phosphodiesterase